MVLTPLLWTGKRHGVETPSCDCRETSGRDPGHGTLVQAVPSGSFKCGWPLLSLDLWASEGFLKEVISIAPDSAVTLQGSGRHSMSFWDALTIPTSEAFLLI